MSRHIHTNPIVQRTLLFSGLLLATLSAFGQDPVQRALDRVTQDAPIYASSAYTIYPKGVVWGREVAEVFGDSAVVSSFENRKWQRSKALPQYPSLQSDYPIVDALYAMAVEELDNLIEGDSTWRTGKWWGGVWTRDVSYSTLLAAAYMQPDVTRISLMKKVHNGRIMEDTGTGGSWPVSTDCVVWAAAAWELYLATGDKDWLKESYAIVRNTLRQDYATVYDQETGLFKGESSFLDWREETYPRWMEPVDISQSECLGTNALYCMAFDKAGEMATLLGEEEDLKWYNKMSHSLREAINKHLWMEDKGYYSQYLYGRTHKIPSPRSETLGEALCVLYGIAPSRRADSVVSNVPQGPLGTPCIAPQIPNIHPYHNNAVWPFVQSFWLRASAKCGNSTSVNHSIGAIFRAAALFATNQENFVAENGDYHTAMNSPNMLWSINGLISIVQHVFAGIRPDKEGGILFAPYIPKEWGGTYRLSHFKCRDADLDIIVEGYGSSLKPIPRGPLHRQEIYIDGVLWGIPYFSASDLKGHHTIRMVLDGNESDAKSVNIRPVATSPETVPEVYLDGSRRLGWRQVPDVAYYKILCNGKVIATQEEKVINGNRYDIPVPDSYTEYQVIAVDKEGNEGFASQPLSYYDLDRQMTFDMTLFAKPTRYAPCKGWSGNGAVEIAAGTNDQLVMIVEVPTAGEYLLDFHYANGSDNLTDNNMCCNRTLTVNGGKSGQMVFPQRAKDLWNLWGWSNKVRVNLKKGKNTIVLSYGSENVNMNREGINRAMLDQLRLIRL